MITSEIYIPCKHIAFWRIRKNSKIVCHSGGSFSSPRSAKRALDRFVADMSLNLNKNLDGSGIEYLGVIK